MVKTAQCHKNSYVYVRQRELEFEFDDWVFLMVSPIIGVMRFLKKV